MVLPSVASGRRRIAAPTTTRIQSDQLKLVTTDSLAEEAERLSGAGQARKRDDQPSRP